MHLYAENLFCHLNDLFAKKNLFILGAGVSIGYIKPNYYLYQNAKKNLKNEIVIYPWNTIDLDSIKKSRFETSF